MPAVAVPTKLSQLDPDIVIDEDDMSSDSATMVPTQQSVKAYVDANADGGGGLSNITESLETSSPNSTVNAESLQVSGGTTDVDLVLGPKGAGAFVVGPPPDGTSTGGNKPGANAIQIMSGRTGAGQVASGANGIAIGKKATASGPESIGIGVSAIGSGNNSVAIGGHSTNFNAVASGTNSIAIHGTASNDASIALGQSSVASDIGAFSINTSLTAYGQLSYGHNGSSFAPTLIAEMRAVTTNDTPAVMSRDRFSTSLFLIPSGGAFSGLVIATAFKSDGSVACQYQRRVLIKNASGTTSIVVNDTVGTDYEGDGAADFAVSADDTNDAMSLTWTGPNSETWRAQALIIGSIFTFGS